jgi:hypothetical protein
MAGKGQLLLGGEDAHPHALGLLHRCRPALDKRGFREVELARNRLHPLGREAAVFITTASGLPASALSVKTSTTK